MRYSRDGKVQLNLLLDHEGEPVEVQEVSTATDETIRTTRFEASIGKRAASIYGVNQRDWTATANRRLMGAFQR